MRSTQCLLLVLSTTALACSAHVEPVASSSSSDASVERGKYLVVTGGCNDCHTQRWAQTGGQVDVADWLTGGPPGYRGPWGTTYASNLRLSVREGTEDQWVNMLKHRHNKPPMPWAAVNAMTDADQRSIYLFIASLGPKGEEEPKDLPAGTEPTTPYISLDVVTPTAK